MKRTKNPTATRAKILQSAHEEFVRYGFQAARLNAIVENAGITKGSVFHHFSGKADLARQWLEETLPPILDECWAAIMESSSDPLASIKSILREQVRRIETTSSDDFHGSPLVTLIASVDQQDAELQSCMLHIQQKWHRMIADALSAGQKNSTVHHAIVPSEEAHLIMSISMGCELQAKIIGYSMLSGYLRSAFAYLDTLRPA